MNDELRRAQELWRAADEPTAAAIVVLHGGLVLIESGPKGDKPIGLPGGKREPGETALECAMRELEEETGMLMSPAYAEHLFTEYAGVHKTAIFFAAPPRKLKTDPRPGVRWVRPSELLVDSRFPDIYARCFAEIIYVLLMGAR